MTQMTKPVVRSSIILLDEDRYENVYVIPKDRDKFILTVEEAVRACRAQANQAAFQCQFRDLLDELTDWVKARRARMQAAHLMIRDSGMLLVVMQKGKEFDRELADELTELDLHVANAESYKLIDLDVMAVPYVSHDSLTAFLSSGQVFSYAK
jgi:hypothetical protein